MRDVPPLVTLFLVSTVALLGGYLGFVAGGQTGALPGAIIGLLVGVWTTRVRSCRDRVATLERRVTALEAQVEEE